MIRIKLLRKHQYVYDMDKNTFDGESIKASDLLMMLDDYSHRHPEDKHSKNVLTYWLGLDLNPNESSQDTDNRIKQDDTP